MGRATALIIVLVPVVLSLAGCSAYQATRAEQEDGLQRDGTYILTEAERAQNCAALQSWIRGYGDSVRKLAFEQAKRQARAPRSVWSGLTRLGGGREANDATQTMCRQYAVMLAMNRELADRSCETVDISALLATSETTGTAPRDGGGPGKIWGVEQGPAPGDYRGSSAPEVCGGR